MHCATLIGKRIIVVGGGVTGGSVVRFLSRNELLFDLVDDAEVPASLSGKVTGQVHQGLDASLLCAFDIIVLSPGIPRAHPAIEAALAEGVRVIGDIELFASAVRVPVLAVTGSNGKSTVVAWIADALNRFGIRAVACGNIGEAALDSLGDDVACHVLELSSYQLESTTSLKPMAATVLNVSDDHLDRYDSVESYAAVKRRVFDQANTLVVNADDPACQPSADVAGRARMVRFSLAGSDDAGGVSAGHVPEWHRGRYNDDVWLFRGDAPLLAQAELPLPGEHNAANALVVMALVRCLVAHVSDELSDARLSALISGFAGLPHRTELVADVNGVRWYNDSKGTNVDACIKAVASMSGPVLLIAGGLAKGADFRPLVPVIVDRARVVVLIGRDRDAIAEVLEDVVDLRRCETMEAAVGVCRELAEPGDVVLLSPACASFDMFDSYEHRGRCFVAAVDEALAA